MKFQGVYFNLAIAGKMTKAEFAKRFTHLWPGKKESDKKALLNQAYELLKNANRK